MVRESKPGSDTLPYLWSQEDDGRSGLKTAIVVAFLVHALIFAVRLPEVARRVVVDDKPKLFPIIPIDLRPPVHTSVEVTRQRKRRVPIPDPTPEGPEPLISAQIIAPPIEMPVDFSLADIPAPPAPTSNVPVRFRPEMTRPVRISGIDPTYTEIARRGRVEGVVILQAVIDKSGGVRDIEVLKPLRLGLDEAAVQAVQTWRFEPAMLDDRPIDVIYNLTVRFGLQ